MAEEPSTRGRTLWLGHVDNDELQRVIVATARTSWPVLTWPRGLSRRDAGELAHAYVIACTRYMAEDGTQYVRTPWAFLTDGVGDCKTTAVFIASLARAAGRSVALRFVRYANAEHFGHVYAVVDGVAADPLLPYGSEPVYLAAKDYPL